jgi:hypothetical protein
MGFVREPLLLLGVRGSSQGPGPLPEGMRARQHHRSIILPVRIVDPDEPGSTDRGVADFAESCLSLGCLYRVRKWTDNNPINRKECLPHDVRQD